MCAVMRTEWAVSGFGSRLGGGAVGVGMECVQVMPVCVY